MTATKKTAAAEPAAIEPATPEDALLSPTEAALDKELDSEELLADLPELRAPHQLRLRHRNRLILLVAKAHDRGLFKSPEEAEKAKASGTLGDVAEIEVMLDLLAEVDEFAESIAVDPEAYAAWATKNSDNMEPFMAILSRYAVSVGE